MTYDDTEEFRKAGYTVVVGKYYLVVKVGNSIVAGIDGNGDFIPHPSRDCNNNPITPKAVIPYPCEIFWGNTKREIREKLESNQPDLITGVKK